MFLLILPVIVPFFRSHGLTMEEVFQVQAFFGFCLVLFEVPSGYISDLFGRKKVLITASFFSGIAFSLLAVSESFTGFLIAEFFAAIAMSFVSGTDIALLYDSIEAMEEKPKHFSEVEFVGKTLFMSQIGESLAAIIGGMLAMSSLLLAAQVNAVVVWIPFFISLTFFEPPRSTLNVQTHRENFAYILRVLFKETRLLRLLVFVNIFYSLSSLLAVWTYQAFWQEIEIPLKYFGYLWAFYNLTVALMARKAGAFERRFGSVFLLVAIGVLPILGYWGMGLFGSIVGVLFGLCFQLCRGLTQVVVRDAVNARVTADIRATVNSIVGLGTRLGFVFLGPALGWLIDHQGFKVSFFSLGSLYVFSFFLLILPLIGQREHFRTVSN